MAGVFVVPVDNLEKTISYMDKVTNEWTDRAARGECAWICADCCVTFPEGMPDACPHGLSSCTEICLRDKEIAKRALKE